MNLRIGIGYDIHKLIVNRKLILGGVEIPYIKGLLGHSDADVLCHAIADALLGAAALGDIGKHFPDTDPRFKDISSLIILKQVGKMLQEINYSIVNIDSTIILQQPRINPYIKRMRENIANNLNIEINQISVKATTNEELDAIGEGEGAACYAVVLIKLIS